MGTSRKKRNLPGGFIIWVLKDELEFSRYKNRERHAMEKGSERTVVLRHDKAWHIWGINRASVWPEMKVGCGQVDSI